MEVKRAKLTVLAEELLYATLHYGADQVMTIKMAQNADMNLLKGF